MAWGRGALNTTVHVGDHHLRRPERDPGMEQVRRTRRIKMHARYDALTTDYDVALIELDRPVRFGEGAAPVCLPNKRKGKGLGAGGGFIGREATVSGWGYTDEDGRSSQVLREVTVTVMEDEKCRRMYKGDKVTERMVCAAVEGGGKDACLGDSGGPLVTEVGAVAIVSFLLL